MILYLTRYDYVMPLLLTMFCNTPRTWYCTVHAFLTRPVIARSLGHEIRGRLSARALLDTNPRQGFDQQVAELARIIKRWTLRKANNTRRQPGIKYLLLFRKSVSEL